MISFPNWMEQKYFSALDLRASYHHIPLDKSLIPKTAFNPPFSKYEYVKVPFRLAQAPAYFQELMTRILKDFDFAIAYLDDIIIFSRTVDEHLSHIRKVFEKLWSSKLSMKLSKCHFFSKEIYFLSHTFSETQRKWSTTEQEAHGVYYAVSKWNYYLQGADIIVRNDHKPLTKFLNGNNANKVNRWGLELATYNITFEWISEAKNKAADCLSCLVELPQTISAPINMLSVSNTDGPTFNTRSQTHQHLIPDTSPAQPSITPEDLPVPHPTPKSLMADRLDALQMQKTYLFCKQISKCLSNGKAP